VVTGQHRIRKDIESYPCPERCARINGNMTAIDEYERILAATKASEPNYQTPFDHERTLCNALALRLPYRLPDQIT